MIYHPINVGKESRERENCEVTVIHVYGKNEASSTNSGERSTLKLLFQILLETLVGHNLASSPGLG